MCIGSALRGCDGRLEWNAMLCEHGDEVIANEYPEVIGESTYSLAIDIEAYLPSHRTACGAERIYGIVFRNDSAFFARLLRFNVALNHQRVRGFLDVDR